MSILIRGMDLPKNCAECPVNLYVCQRGYEYLLEHPELYDQRAEDCPISYVPAADVVHVRHGRWVTKKDACGIDYTICSACETEIQWRDRHGVILKVDMQTAPYCPNCGARMDGDGDA